MFSEAELRGLPFARIRRIQSSEYPTTARRPGNSVLDTTKVEKTYGVASRPWRAALAEVMDIIAASPQMR